MARRGRKPKLNVIRDARGKSRGEALGVHPETLAIRLRDLRRDGLRAADAKDALDARSGFTLGRLLLRHRADPSDPGSVNEQQYDAGQQWARLARRHAVLMGYASGSPVSPSFVMVGSGVSCAASPTEAEIAAVRRQWSECHRALMEAAKTHGLAVRDVVHAVCVENRSLEFLDHADYGNLRIGLNALAKVMRPAQRQDRADVQAWSA
jgi:hypothetical protein